LHLQTITFDYLVLEPLSLSCYFGIVSSL